MKNYGRGNLVASVSNSTRIYLSMYVYYLHSMSGLLTSYLQFDSQEPGQHFESDSDGVDESLTIPQQPQDDVGTPDESSGTLLIKCVG